MRKGSIFTLLLALALGGLSAYLARDWIQEHSRPVVVQDAKPGIETTTVIVTRKALRFGDPLSEAVVEAIAWPAGSVPQGTFRSTTELYKDGGDRVVLRAMEAGEPVLSAKISGSGERATLSRLIDGGMRAVTIRVNDVVGVAGFVLPGDRVDVLLTRRPAQEDPVTDIVMQNIKVLGIDQDIDEGREKPTVAKAVTVEVTSPQAQKLALAQQVGQLTLALRNEANGAKAAALTISVEDLSSGGRSHRTRPALAAHSRPAAPPAVTVVRRLEASREEVMVEPVIGYSSARSKPLKLVPKTPVAATSTRKPEATNAPAETAELPSSVGSGR